MHFEVVARINHLSSVAGTGKRSMMTIHGCQSPVLCRNVQGTVFYSHIFSGWGYGRAHFQHQGQPVREVDHSLLCCKPDRGLSRDRRHISGYRGCDWPTGTGGMQEPREIDALILWKQTKKQGHLIEPLFCSSTQGLLLHRAQMCNCWQILHTRSLCLIYCLHGSRSPNRVTRFCGR